MKPTIAVTLSILIFTAAAHADTFGTGANAFDIEFVTIGNPGNVDDPLRAIGSVDYVFRIGKYEISEDMVNKANAEGGLGITHNNRGANKPVSNVSWFEAVKFANWLNISTNRSPAYKFDTEGNFQVWQPSDVGYNPNNIYRNSQAKYFLPSSNEWHKAAYYDPTASVYYVYPTGKGSSLPSPIRSGTTPGTAVYQVPFPAGPADITQAGGLSPYGTMAQGGNVYEWQEVYLYKDNVPNLEIRGYRGGSYSQLVWPMASVNYGYNVPRTESSNVGFRVASIPEPDSFLLGVLAGLTLLIARSGTHDRRDAL